MTFVSVTDSLLDNLLDSELVLAALDSCIPSGVRAFLSYPGALAGSGRKNRANLQDQPNRSIKHSENEQDNARRDEH